MATIFSTGFEDGTLGATLVNGSSGLTYAYNAPKYVAGLRGSLAVRCDQLDGRISYELPGLTNTLYTRFYTRVDALGQFYMAQIQTETLARGQLRAEANGGIRCRGSAPLGGNPLGVGALSGGTVVRVEWGVTATTQQLRLYVGDNRHGTTADYDSGPLAWTPVGTFDRIQIGRASSTAGIDLTIDDLALSDSGWLGPAAVAVPLATPVVTLGAATPVSAAGATDGAQVVTWPTVPGAGSYVAGIYHGSGTPAQGSITEIGPATSPYTFTGLPAGPHYYAIKALP